MALVAAGGCTETLTGFQASYASNVIAIAAEAPSGNRLRFKVRKQISPVAIERDYKGATESTNTRPRGAVLKLAGFMPMLPDSVEETGDAYLVTMTLPQDLIRAAGSHFAGQRFPGELYLPVETGVRAYTGVVFQVPATYTLSASLTPVFTGPGTRLAESVGSFFRGLYSAR